MPLPALGLLGMLGNVGRAGMAGYRTLRGIRAARQAAGIPMGYQRVLGTSGPGLGSGSGLQGLMGRGAKKFPGATGTAEAGTGVLLGGQGVGDVVQGTREGDYGQALMGLGSLALGAPLLGRGARLMGSQRTLAKKMPETAQALRTTGKEFVGRMPKYTTPVGFGAFGVGALTAQDAEAEPQVLSDNPVDVVVKSIEYAKENPEEFKKEFGFDVNSNEFKDLAKQKLTEAYQVADKQDIEQPKTLDDIVKPYLYDTKDTGGVPIVNESSVPDDKGDLSGTELSAGDVQDIAEHQNQQVEKGKKIKEKIEKSAAASEFNKFYNEIANLTGGNDQTNNLLLFKFATGLMSGKTGQEGVRGFLDVVGQAGSGVADTALALFTKEQDRRNDLAVAYLKAKEKQGTGLGAIEKDRRTVVIRDPNLPFGARSVEVATDKKTGLDMMIVPRIENGQNVGTMAVPMQYTDYTPVKVSEARLDKRRKQLRSIQQGYELTQKVDQLPKGTFGTKGTTKLYVENVLGTFGDIGEMLGLGNLGTTESPIDATIINDYIGGEKLDEAGNVRPPTEAERKEMNELQEQYRNEIRDITADISPNETDLDNITKARLIQVRMKYILANALKDEDRLTRADIEDAAQSTEVLKFFSSDKAIRSSYRNLAKNLEKQFERVGTDFIEAGGSEKYLMSFDNMPYIAEIKAKAQNALMSNQIQQQNMNVLGTIK